MGGLANFRRSVGQYLIYGLSLGAVYALIAVGYTMVYGIVRLINFAHGDVYMVGAYLGYFAITLFRRIRSCGHLVLVCRAFCGHGRVRACRESSSNAWLTNPCAWPPASPP